MTTNHLQRVLTDLGLEYHSALQLLNMLGAPEPPVFQSPFSALLWLETMTQAYWLRKPGIEYWQQQDHGTLIAARREINTLLQKLGVLTEIRPKCQHYGTVLVIGGYAANFQARLNFLEELWLSDVHFNRIYLLGRQRPLAQREEIQWLKPGAAATESNMMLAQYHATREHWPTAMQTIPCVIVSAPNAQAELAQSIHASTSDMTHFWWQEMQDLPAPTKQQCFADLLQSILVIGNQPYLRYQHAVIKRELTFLTQQARLAMPAMETVGPSALENEYAAHVLDSLARYIYTEYSKLERCYLNKEDASREAAI